jgi:hypothetical protein
MIGRPPGNWNTASAGVSALMSQFCVAAPADFDAREQIGLGARQAEKPCRLELGIRSENLWVGCESDGVPRRLGVGPNFSSFPWDGPAREALAEQFLLRATSTTVSIDSAFTTETPTPCKPPEVE